MVRKAQEIMSTPPDWFVLGAKPWRELQSSRSRAASIALGLAIVDHAVQPNEAAITVPDRKSVV